MERWPLKLIAMQKRCEREAEQGMFALAFTIATSAVNSTLAHRTQREKIEKGNYLKRRDLHTLSLFDIAELKQLHNDCGRENSPKKTQKEQIIEALKEPKTITELYRALPHISEDNIAPLVRYLHLDGIVYNVGTRSDLTKKGLKRDLTVWSSRAEDKPEVNTLNLLTSLFGAKVDVNKLQVTGYVVKHIMEDAQRGIKTNIK